MSKFRDTSPSDPPSTTGEKVVAFPASDGMPPERRKAELEAFRHAADEELLLRIRYSLLKDTLDKIDRYDPVPDDWRARLLDRERSNDVAFEDDAEDADEEDEEDEEDED